MLRKFLIILLLSSYSFLFVSCSNDTKLLQELSDEKCTYTASDVQKALQQGALKKYFPKVKNYQNIKITKQKQSEIPYQIFEFDYFGGNGYFLVYKNKLIILGRGATSPLSNCAITKYNGKWTLFYTYDIASGIYLYRFEKYVFGEETASNVDLSKLPKELDNWASHERNYMKKHFSSEKI